MEQPQQGSKIRLKFKLGKSTEVTEIPATEIPPASPTVLSPPPPVDFPRPVVKSTGLKITIKKQPTESPKPPTPVVEEKVVPKENEYKRKTMEVNYVESEDEEEQDEEEATETPSKKEGPKKKQKVFEGMGRLTMKETLEILLQELMNKDVRGCFHEPVPLDTPSYYDLIKQPMDFSTMKKKIEKNEYQYLDQFENDVALICNNATTYNPSNTIWYKDAKALFVKWKKLARQAQSHLEPTVLKTPIPTRPKTRNTTSTPSSVSQLSPPSLGTPSSPGPAIPSTPLTSTKKRDVSMLSKQESKSSIPSPAVVAAAVQRSAIQNPSVLSTTYSSIVPKQQQQQFQPDASMQKPPPYSSYISNYLMWQRTPTQLSVPQSGMISTSNNALKNIYVVPDAQYIGGLESFVEKMGPRAIESVQLYLSHLRDPALKMVISSPPLVPERTTKPQVQVSNSVLEDLKLINPQPVTESQLMELSSLQTQGYDVSFLGTLAPQLRVQLIDVPRSSSEVPIDKQNTQEILDQNTQNLILLSTLQVERLTTSKEKNKPLPKEEAIALNIAKGISELGALVPPDYLTSYKELLTGST